MTAVRDRLIFALDVPTAAEARAWVDRLGDSVGFYKIGMELCMAPGFFELPGAEMFEPGTWHSMTSFWTT